MARYVDTLATAEEKSELSETLKTLARGLTRKGMGKTHYVALERKRGTWMVNLYKR